MESEVYEIGFMSNGFWFNTPHGEVYLINRAAVNYHLEYYLGLPSIDRDTIITSLYDRGTVKFTVGGDSGETSTPKKKKSAKS